MNILERILNDAEKEFDKRIKTQLKIMAGLGDEVYRYGHGKSLEAYQQSKLLVEEIIRSHMEDDGWIPIENGLPPIGKPLIVTVKDNMQEKTNELRYPVYYEKDGMKNGCHWSWRYGEFAYELLPDVSEVVAWKYLPEPYCPKED